MLNIKKKQKTTACNNDKENQKGVAGFNWPLLRMSPTRRRLLLHPATGALNRCVGLMPRALFGRAEEGKERFCPVILGRDCDLGRNLTFPGKVRVDWKFRKRFIEAFNFEGNSIHIVPMFHALIKQDLDYEKPSLQRPATNSFHCCSHKRGLRVGPRSHGQALRQTLRACCEGDICLWSPRKICHSRLCHAF